MAYRKLPTGIEKVLKSAIRFLWTENALALTLLGAALIAISWMRTHYPAVDLRSHLTAAVMIFGRLVRKLGQEGEEEVPAPQPRAKPNAANSQTRGPKASGPAKPGAPRKKTGAKKKKTGKAKARGKGGRRK